MLLMAITELLQQHLSEKKNGKIIRHITELKNIIFFLPSIFLMISYRIIDYNRTIKDLNGLTPKEF